MSDRVQTVLSLVSHVLLNHGKAEDTVLESKRRDKIRCDGVRPCASCVRKGLECIERACKDCSREGRAAECTHRKAQVLSLSMAEASGTGDIEDKNLNSYPEPSEKDYSSQPLQRIHLPPISHPPYPPPPPHAMYPPPNPMNHMVPTQYYYPHQGMIGPGQPPQPPMQPYVQHIPNERAAYYPAIDPNIDSQSSSGPSVYQSNSSTGQHQDAGPSGTSLASSSR